MCNNLIKFKAFLKRIVEGIKYLLKAELEKLSQDRRLKFQLEQKCYFQNKKSCYLSAPNILQLFA